MKPFLLALLLLPLFGHSQTLALMDRRLVSPMKLAHNVQLREVQSNLFPVYLQDLDSVIQALEDYRKWIDTGGPEPAGTGLRAVGASSFFTDRYSYGPRERYRIVFSTGSSDYKTSMVLVDNTLSPRQAVKNLTGVIDYLRNNLAVVKEAQAPRP